MNDIKGQTRFRRGELVGSRIQDEMVFFHQETGKYYSTGPVGADIWDYLESSREFSAICDHLLSLYDIDKHSCEAEATAFLIEMTTARLVVREYD